MNELVFILLFVGLLTLIVAIVPALIIVKRKKAGDIREPNYRVFFIMGICFLPFGIPLWIATGNPGLMGISAMGIFYMALGLAHRDKWDEHNQ